jgi:hypothetical protein
MENFIENPSVLDTSGTLEEGEEGEEKEASDLNMPPSWLAKAESISVHIGPLPKLHLIDMLWNSGYRVTSDVLAELAGIQATRTNLPNIFQVFLGQANTTHTFPIRFIQGSSKLDFSKEDNFPLVCDIILAVDRDYKSLTTFRSGLVNKLHGLRMRHTTLVPFLQNTATQGSIISSAWTDTNKINNEVFGSPDSVNPRKVYAAYKSVADALIHILDAAHASSETDNENPFTVVIVCDVGKERSLLLTVVMLVMLHALSLMNKSPNHSLRARVAYMKQKLQQLDLSTLARNLVKQATPSIQSCCDRLPLSLAYLTVPKDLRRDLSEGDDLEDEVAGGEGDEDAEVTPRKRPSRRGIKRPVDGDMRQCVSCKNQITWDKNIDFCPVTGFVVCNSSCLVNYTFGLIHHLDMTDVLIIGNNKY